MELKDLQEVVRSGAALRRRQRLQPAAGPGDKLFPPTYPSDSGPTHVFERRRIDGEERVCVLIDSVQSQANRLEEALLGAAEEHCVRLPRLTVDFPGAGLNSVGPISVLQAPHRIFDAILRDSELEGNPFPESDIGKALRKATPSDAKAILEVAPTALLFGAWNSTGESGGIGAKFARAIVSEVIGVDAVVGKRAGVRIDPIGVLSAIKVIGNSQDWKIAAEGEKGARKPSEINHSNIIAGIKIKENGRERRIPIWEQGVTCAYALQTQVLTFAGLRRLRFGTDEDGNLAARTYLAAIGIVAMIEGNRQGMALRSRCDLVCEDGLAPLEVIAFDGTTREIEIDPEGAFDLHEAAFEAARKVGFDLVPEPIVLKPQEKLVELVRLSQQKALADEGGEADEE